MRWHTWQRLFGEARTRISISYFVLMLFFAGVSIPTIRQVLFSRVQERIERSLDQEVEEFRRLIGRKIPEQVSYLVKMLLLFLMFFFLEIFLVMMNFC
ncbi:hypothetical protein [Leptolyngbya sp. FACHB-261]|uniref:hypothetical protein n=1 Tax=Leptolyngbya sp. FACHB-261 TaxID=2692806 RepID=UPI0018EF6A64|nr:hypothetical protein [Leptolyngbya sp. FACHB-261]